MIYFTSDLHFGHINILRHCDRPFADIDEMDRELIARWNRRVTPQDDVYIWVISFTVISEAPPNTCASWRGISI